MIMPRVDQKGLTLTVDLDPGVPHYINTDAGKLREMLDLSGADGAMIGRGAYGRPWIIGERGLPSPQI